MRKPDELKKVITKTINRVHEMLPWDIAIEDAVESGYKLGFRLGKKYSKKLNLTKNTKKGER